MPYKDKEKRIQATRNYEERNPEKIKLWSHASYLKNREQRLENRRTYVQAHKKEIASYVKDKYERRKKAINEYKLRKSCLICGYNKCSSALDFHHKNPKEKERIISSMIASCSWKKILEEIKKCIVLCANHHREFEEGLLDLEFYLGKEKEISLPEKI